MEICLTRLVNHGRAVRIRVDLHEALVGILPSVSTLVCRSSLGALASTNGVGGPFEDGVHAVGVQPRGHHRPEEPSKHVTKERHWARVRIWS